MSRPQDQLRQLNQSYQQAQINQSMGMQNQSLMPQSFQQTMMSPAPFNQTSFMGNVTQQGRDNFPIQVEFSAKHNGLYIYVGRILSPIWNLKCVTKSLTPDNKEFVSMEYGNYNKTKSKINLTMGLSPIIPLLLLCSLYTHAKPVVVASVHIIMIM